MFWLDSRVLQSTRISITVARGISQTEMHLQEVG